MDVGSLFLFLALLILVAWFISRPIFDPQFIPDKSDEVKEHELSTLLAEKDRVLNALQELDFDYTLGKVPEEDYPIQRRRMMQYGAEVLSKLDQYQGRSEPTSSSAENAEARLEAAIAARVDTSGAPLNGGNGAGAVPAYVADPDDSFEVMLATRRRVRQEKAAGFCPKCGGPVQLSDQFCPKCGKRLL